MDQAVSSATPSIHPGRPETADTLLGGYHLLAARVVWLTVAIASVALFLASIPPYYADLLALSGSHIEWASDSVRAGLEQLSISVHVYAAYTVVVMIALAVVFIGTGALIFWRKPNDRAALYFSLTLVVFGVVWPNTLDSLVGAHPGLEAFVRVLGTWGFASFFLLFYIFPDGRFVPHWTRWAAVVFVVETVLAEHFRSSPLAPDNWPLFLSVPFYVLLLGSVIMSPIYRYWCRSGPVERQQLKWVTSSLVVALVSLLGIGALSGVPALSKPGIPAALLALSGPVAFGLVFIGSLLTWGGRWW